MIMISAMLVTIMATRTSHWWSIVIWSNPWPTMWPSLSFIICHIVIMILATFFITNLITIMTCIRSLLPLCNPCSNKSHHRKKTPKRLPKLILRFEGPISPSETSSMIYSQFLLSKLSFSLGFKQRKSTTLSRWNKMKKLPKLRAGP